MYCLTFLQTVFSIDATIIYSVSIHIVFITSRQQGMPELPYNWARLAKKGHIWNLLRSVSVHYGSKSQNVLKVILKSPRFVPFGAWSQTYHPCNVDIILKKTKLTSSRDLSKMCFQTISLYSNEPTIC